jgi:hypothetical protein
VIAAAPVPLTRWQSVVLDDQLYVLTSEVGRADSPVAFLRYDPAGDVWTRLPVPDVDSNAVALVAGDHAVIAVASSDESASRDMIFEVARRAWRRLPDDPLRPSSSRSAAWLGDRLLLAATPGVADPELGQHELKLAILDIASMRWGTLPSIEIGGGYPVVAAGSVVYPFFNFTGERVGQDEQLYPNGALLDLSRGSWRMLSGRPRGKGLNAYGISAGLRTFVGGHLVDPRTGAWTMIPTPPWSERNGEAVLAGPNSIFVWGGTSSDGSAVVTNLADGYLLRLPPT